MKIGYVYGVIGILAGLLLIATSIHFDPNTVPAQHGIGHATIKLLETIGVTLFGLGMLNLVLETKDWRDYFERRLQNLVLDQTYLGTMDAEALRSLQVKLLKAQVKDQHIDREGSFLNYFHSNLHRYIAEPYREDVTAEVMCSEDGHGNFNVFDRVTYVCRRSAAGIQPSISWAVDKGEYMNVDKLIISVQYPYNHEKKGEQRELYNGIPAAGSEQVFSLENFADVDGLIVIVNCWYKVSGMHFQYWSMAHPTRNFDITITYPPRMDIFIKAFVVNPELVLWTRCPGYCKAKYDSWMLPESSVAWRVLPSDTPAVTEQAGKVPDTTA